MEWVTPRRIPWSLAHQLFSKHHQLSSPYMPEPLAKSVHLVPASGGWAEFAALCKRVRSQTSWDWKYTILKKVTLEHSKACGWTTEQRLRQIRDTPDLNHLYQSIGGHIVCLLQWSWPRFEQAGKYSESGSFYYEYCVMDFQESIEWQLAEPDCPLTDNPFYPLLRCYAAGYYPFSRGPDSVVMFSFTKPR